MASSKGSTTIKVSRNRPNNCESVTESTAMSCRTHMVIRRGGDPLPVVTVSISPVLAQDVASLREAAAWMLQAADWLEQWRDDSAGRSIC